MPFDLTTVMLTGMILFLAAVGQSAVGFGYGLFSTGLLIWLGLPLPNIIALVGTCSMLLSLLGSRRLQSHVPWRLVAITAGIRLVSVVIGILLLRKLVALEPNTVRLVVSAALCAVVTLQLLWRPRPVPHLHPAWAGLAFSCSGILSGFCGMGGPPMVIWLMAHDWPSQKTRSFLFTIFAVSIPFQLTLLSFTFGMTIVRSVVAGVICIPLVYAGSLIGMPLGDRLSRNALRGLAYAILFLIGVTGIVRAVF